MDVSARQRFIGKGDKVPMQDIGFFHRECLRQGFIRHRDRLKFSVSSTGRPKLNVKEFNGLVHEYRNPQVLRAVLRIRMFLGLLDPHPDPLVSGTGPDPEPSIIKQK
jgi:hypothetical protein